MKCAPPFSLQGFPTFFGSLSPYRCARNFDRECEVEFFLPFCLWNYYAYTYSLFYNISHTLCEKNGHPPLGLSSKVFTFDHFFGHRSDFINNLAICLFFYRKWPEDFKYRCLSSSTNSVGLHFHEGAEKIKENDKNTTIENLQNGQEKYGGKNLAYVYSWGKN